MAQPNVTVKRITPSEVEITNVQSVQLSKGRTKVSDDYRPGTATVNGRRPDLLPALEIGDTVQLMVQNPDTFVAVQLNYRVSDLTVNYGIISALDTWTLELEDAFAYLGRATINQTWTANTLASSAAYDVCATVGITLVKDKNSLSTLSAQTVTNGAGLDVFQTIANTEQALVQAAATTITWFSRGWQSNITYYEFSDTGTTNVKYDGLTFGSLADNYADKVVVYPRGSTEVVTGSGIFGYNLDSYSFNSAEATNLGLYVKGIFDVQNSTPQTVSVLLNTDNTPATDSLRACATGSGIKLVFRGITYYSLVQGYTITSDPTATRITYNLSSADFYSFLTLNNTTLGRLDYNKLGF